MIGINAANLGAEGFELEIPGGEGKTIRVALGQSGGLSGRYEQDGSRITLREVVAHQLSLEALALPLAGGLLRSEGSSILSGLDIDAELGGSGPFTGRAKVASAGLLLAFERGPLLLRAGVSASSAAYERRDGTQRAELDSVELEALRVELDGKPLLHVTRLSLRGVRCVVGAAGELSLSCAVAHAESIALERDGRSLRLEQVAFAKGFSLKGDVLRWPELLLGRLAVAAPELLTGAPAKGEAARPGRERTTRAPLQLPLLDQLRGMIAFDLFLDVRIPILPDRRATHSIRVPVADGAIDFKQLESCFAKLEDALLDFEVDEEGLLLEFDPIPGLKLDNVPLVHWPLSGQEHALAKTRHQIRLRRLLEYRLSSKLAGEATGAGSDRPSPLRRVHVGNIETVLALSGPIAQELPGLGVLHLGAFGAPAAAELRLRGELDHAPGELPSKTELRLEARELLLGAAIVDERGRRIEIERLAIAHVDALRLGLLGLTPRSLSVAAEGLRLAGVELRGWFGGASAATGA